MRELLLSFTSSLSAVPLAWPEIRGPVRAPVPAPLPSAPLSAPLSAGPAIRGRHEAGDKHQGPSPLRPPTRGLSGPQITSCSSTSSFSRPAGTEAKSEERAFVPLHRWLPPGPAPQRFEPCFASHTPALCCKTPEPEASRAAGQGENNHLQPPEREVMEQNERSPFLPFLPFPSRCSCAEGEGSGPGRPAGSWLGASSCWAEISASPERCVSGGRVNI